MPRLWHYHWRLWLRESSNTVYLLIRHTRSTEANSASVYKGMTQQQNRHRDIAAVQAIVSSPPVRMTLQSTSWFRLLDALYGIWASLLQGIVIVWATVVCGRQNDDHHLFSPE